MRSVRGAALLVAVATIAACGLAAGDPETLPGGVVAPAVPPPPVRVADTGPHTGAQPVRIFLVAGDQIVEAARSTSTPGLAATLQLLLDGPTAAEIDGGTRSAVAAGTRVLSARLEAGTAVVDLSSAFVDLGGEEQILAVAQMVLTATAVPGVDRVRFALDGAELEVPRPDGTLVRGPLTAADYAPLRAEAAAP